MEGRESGWLLETCRSTVLSSKEASPNRAVSSRALSRVGTTLSLTSPLIHSWSWGHDCPTKKQGVAWGVSTSFNEDHQICQERALVKHASFQNPGDFTIGL